MNFLLLSWVWQMSKFLAITTIKVNNLPIMWDMKIDIYCIRQEKMKDEKSHLFKIYSRVQIRRRRRHNRKKAMTIQNQKRKIDRIKNQLPLLRIAEKGVSLLSQRKSDPWLKYILYISDRPTKVGPHPRTSQFQKTWPWKRGLSRSFYISNQTIGTQAAEFLSQAPKRWDGH